MTFHNPNSQRGNLLDCPALPILRLHSLLIAVEYRLQQLGIRENWFCSSVVSVYRTTNKKQDTLAVSAVNTVCGFVSGYHSVPLCSSHQTLFCLLTDYLLYLGPLLIVRSSDRDTSLLQKNKRISAYGDKLSRTVYAMSPRLLHSVTTTGSVLLQCCCVEFKALFRVTLGITQLSCAAS